jgi:hypothetical protein
MRISFWIIPTLLTIATVPNLQTSGAQATGAVGSAPTASTLGCTGLPYSGKETQTDIKTNEDGTTTEQSSVQLVWRDVDGRTRRETKWKTRSGEEAKEHHVIVYEPLKRVWWTWFYGGSSAKVARVRHFRPQDGPDACPAPPVHQAKRNPEDFDVEYLPAATINGIPVVVHRNTKVVPAGTAGINHEFIIAHEWWISPELGVIMRRTIDDPRSPKIIVELSDVKRDVPDPALFRVPEGYEVVEQPPPTPTVLDEIMRNQKSVIPAPPSREPIQKPAPVTVATPHS